MYRAGPSTARFDNQVVWQYELLIGSNGKVAAAKVTSPIDGMMFIFLSIRMLNHSEF